MSTERWDEITRWVDAEGRVGLGALAARFSVSEMTIRRDLDALTAAGRLRRVRGGAVSTSDESPASPGSGSSAAPTPAPPVPTAPQPAVPAPPAVPAGAPAVTAPAVGGDRTSPDAEAHLSPADRPSRAPSSLGSVIASWAGSLPAGFPTPPDREPVTATTTATGAPDQTSSPPERPGAAGRPRTAAPAAEARPEAPTTPAATPSESPGSWGSPSDSPPGWDVPSPGHRSPAPSRAPATDPRAGAVGEDPWARAAEAALGDLAPGSAVLLTGGTGCLALAHHLARAAVRTPGAGLTVAVTALAPATVLAGTPGVRLVVIGGEVEPGGHDLVGPAALTALDDLHLDVAVLTPAGLDARGAWAATSAGAALLAAAVARAESAVAVVAPTALGRAGLVRAAPLSALTRVVAVPAPGEDAAGLAHRLQLVRSGAPSAPVLVGA